MEVKIMDKLLQEVTNKLDFVLKDLRQINDAGTPIDSLIVLPLIKKTVELQRNINNITHAYKIDTRISNKEHTANDSLVAAAPVLQKPKGCENMDHEKEYEYFGDGVYGAFDGYGLELRANDYENPTDRIYLESEVLMAINNFMDKEYN